MFSPAPNLVFALLLFINKIANAIDNVLHTAGIFLDFSKAFHTINHDILLHKLSHYGVRGRALEWFRSYLSGRKQFVYRWFGIDSSTNYLWRPPRFFIRSAPFYLYTSMISKTLLKSYHLFFSRITPIYFALTKTQKHF